VELFAAVGDTVSVGGDLFKIEPGEGGSKKPAPITPEPVKEAPKVTVETTPTPLPKEQVKAKAPAPQAVEKNAAPAPTAKVDASETLLEGQRLERAVLLYLI
jgi:pyruvate/2-oxoglutarate dehydrogenase complex dihydrolipoamide acyltransferase (E2) component